METYDRGFNKETETRDGLDLKTRGKRRKRSPISRSQVNLVTRKTGRQMEKETQAKEQIKHLRYLHETLTFYLSEEGSRNVTITALHLQRRGPSYDDYWWWLGFDMENLGLSDAPDEENYKWGSYWTGSEKDVERFVLDRAKWALPVIEEEIKSAEETIENLEKPAW